MHGAKWARDEGLSHIWMEGDCERIVGFMKGKLTLMDWRNHMVVKEAIQICSDCNNFLGFKFVHRSGNSVADKLMAEARKATIFNTWKGDFPAFLNTCISINKLGTQVEGSATANRLLSQSQNWTCPILIT